MRCQLSSSTSQPSGRCSTTRSWVTSCRPIQQLPSEVPSTSSNRANAGGCLPEKGGSFHQVPAHHNAEAYLEVAGIWNEKGTPLWRSMTRDGTFIRTPGTALPRYTGRCHERAQLAAGLQREAADRKTATTTIVIRNMRATWAPKPTRDHTTSRPRPVWVRKAAREPATKASSRPGRVVALELDTPRTARPANAPRQPHIIRSHGVPRRNSTSSASKISIPRTRASIRNPRAIQPIHPWPNRWAPHPGVVSSASADPLTKARLAAARANSNHRMVPLSGRQRAIMSSIIPQAAPGRSAWCGPRRGSRRRAAAGPVTSSEPGPSPHRTPGMTARRDGG